MRMLFIDVASHDGGCACSTEKRSVAWKGIGTNVRDHELMRLIEEVIKEAGWGYQDLTHIACVTGPGGFTSLRTGVSCANALAWALNLPIAGIHRSDLYGVRARHCALSSGQNDPMPFLWVHSTKAETLFVRDFFTMSRMWPSPTLITLDALVNAYPEGIKWCGELLPTHEEALKKRGGTRMPVSETRDVLIGLSTWDFGEGTLVPWYGREG